MRSSPLGSHFFFASFIISSTIGTKLLGVEDTNTGYHFYDVNIQENILRGYLYRRGKVVGRLANSDSKIVKEELEYLNRTMLVQRAIAGMSIFNCGDL
nr:unnamed protein product [Fasciola hepatica]